MKLEFSEKEKVDLEKFGELCNQVNFLRAYPCKTLSYKYEVFFTGIGIGCRVRCVELEMVKDITDYDIW